MSVNEVPNIGLDGSEIPFIGVNGTGIQLIQTLRPPNTFVRGIGNRYIAENRVWLNSVPQAIPPTVPVTTLVGTPIVNIPGCVQIHKENNKRDPSRNKLLVDDDPKGNTVLCDAGAPYYEPPEYDYRDLTWQTITQEQPEAGGVDTGEAPPTDIDTPQPPVTPPTGDKEVECPPLNARRIGDLNTKGDERVKEYKLTPDGKICETIWEPVPQIEQYLPSVGLVTTTATIATVATASALFAKPLADLLLKVVKPVVKKAIAKVQKMLGKNPRRPTLTEKRTDQYREKKGLLPLKKK